MKLKDLDFRIWHKERGYLDDPAYIFYQFCVEKDFDECFKHKCFDEMKVELWSGLKDFKGRKIFEGDIVNNIDLEAEYRVVYQGEFLLFPIEYESKIPLQRELAIRLCVLASEAIEILDSFEIIGNIHKKIKTHKCYQDSIKRLSLKVGSKELQNEFCQKEAMNGN